MYDDYLNSFTILILIIILVVVIILFFYVNEMATKNGRDLLFWVIFSIIFTPMLGIILLACIGETEQKRRERKIAEREYFNNLGNIRSDSCVQNPKGDFSENIDQI